MLNSDEISNALNGITSGSGFISSLIAKRERKYERSEAYLARTLEENGRLTEHDIDLAAKLYGIHSLRRRIKRMAKILEKADSIVEPALQDAVEDEWESPTDEWLDYFFDKASFVDDEQVQSIWAAILAAECSGDASVKKVMLDRLALLDKDSAEAFGCLCKLTIMVEFETGEVYAVPLYVRDDDLKRMLENSDEAIERDVIRYQKARPSESELELLQEVGLIVVADIQDEGEIVRPEPFEYSVICSGRIIYESYAFRNTERSQHYFVPSGVVRYTSTGVSLYKALANSFSNDFEVLSTIAKAYYDHYRIW